MIVVGSFKSNTGEIPLHLDSGDCVNVLLSLGDNSVIGGETIYFDGDSDNKKGKLVASCAFKHGRIQIGNGYHKFYHGTNKWLDRKRGVINFSLKRKILHHFYKHGTRFYDRYVKDGYPSKHYVAN